MWLERATLTTEALSMNAILRILALIAAGMFSTAGLAATVEEEQAFIDTYRAAFEAQHADALKALLFSDDAVPQAAEFYGMMMTAEFGHPITSIELKDLDENDLAEIDEAMPMPDGGLARLAPRPYKKLVIVVQTSEGDSSSTTTSSAFVAEHLGRLGIAMPVAAAQ